VAELVANGTPTELANALDSGTRKRLTAPSVVERRLEELGRQGRRGVARFDAIMRDAGVESWLERKFLRLVKPTGLPDPTLQRSYRAGDHLVARVDFDFAPLPIVVEVGGQRGYMSAAERRRKERRRNELQLLGKVIYFFTSEDVTARPEYVLDTVAKGIRLVS